MVVSGHTHKAKFETRNGVAFFNPGSAGPRRFKLPVSIGIVEVDVEQLMVRIVELTPER